jgi:hypothetical protein
MCVPMIPECAVADFLNVMKWLVPVQLTWPAALQKVPNCAFNQSVPFPDCFISCASAPYRYRSWEASAAWAAWDWDPEWAALTLTPWARENGLTLLWAELVDKSTGFLALQDQPAGSPAHTEALRRIEAERFCFSVTLVNVAPYLFVVLAAVYASSALIVLPLTVVQAFVDLFVSSVAYVHMMAPRKRVAGRKRGRRGGARRKRKGGKADPWDS